MSKTFVFKRNRSEDVWKPTQSSPSSRRKASLPRASSGGFYQSEFPLQDSLSRESPAMSSPRRRNSASPALSPAGQRRPQRHRDLKRKFIFDLHDEIKKPVHTTPLEEISDMERITSICYGTLHAMMENKHQRKFLHHMNSSHNNSNYSNSTRSSKPPHPCRNPTAAADAPSWDIDVFSANINNNNNSSAPVHEYNISQNFNKYVNKDITDQIKKNKEIMLDEERGRETMANSSHPPPRRKSQIPTSNHSLGSSISRGSESSLKLGLGPSKNNLIDAKKPSKESFASSKQSGGRGVQSPAVGGKNTAKIVGNPGLMKRFSIASSARENLATKQAVEALNKAMETNPQRRNSMGAALKDHKAEAATTTKMTRASVDFSLAESTSEQNPDPYGVSQKKKVTPKEALMTPWLRLSPSQVHVLEELCREGGEDPGIHRHYNVDKYDCFDEVRDLRKKGSDFADKNHLDIRKKHGGKPYTITVDEKTKTVKIELYNSKKTTPKSSDQNSRRLSAD